MESVGKYLKSKREFKRIPLGLIAKELKISSSILSKIETDQIELDKDAIFYIGHVRSYCNYLELETDIIVQQFKFQISYNKNEVVQNIAKPKFQKDYLNYRFFLPVSSILIILSTFYFLFVYNKDDERQYALIPDLPENYVPLIEEEELSQTKNKINNNTNNINNNISIDSFSSAIASNKTDFESKNNIVTLKLLNPTWVQLRNASNNIIISKLMDKDEEFSYDLDLEYNITAGNAGNILVIINNDVRGKVGKYGEIVDS